MPSRWESSTRPLVVRTVWVNGLRHAILSPCDPITANTCPVPESPSSASTSPSRSPSAASDGSDSGQGQGQGPARPQRPQRQPSRSALHPACGGERSSELSQCLVRWKLVVGKAGRGRGRAPEHDDGTEADAEEDGDDAPPLPAPPPTLLGSYCDTFRPLCVPLSAPTEAAAPAPDPSQTGQAGQPQTERRPPDGPEADLNPLSERVLQWLDLAGRAAKGCPLKRGASCQPCPLRKSALVPATAAAAPRPRKFYPVAATEVPALDRRLASTRSMSVDAPKRAAAARPPSAPPLPPPPHAHAPLVQTFQHAAVSRGWAGGGAAGQARPQLHIFVPAVPEKCNLGHSPQEGLGEFSDCESGISDA